MIVQGQPEEEVDGLEQRHEHSRHGSLLSCSNVEVATTDLRSGNLLNETRIIKSVLSQEVMH